MSIDLKAIRAQAQAEAEAQMRAAMVAAVKDNRLSLLDDLRAAVESEDEDQVLALASAIAKLSPDAQDTEAESAAEDTEGRERQAISFSKAIKIDIQTARDGSMYAKLSPADTNSPSATMIGGMRLSFPIPKPAEVGGSTDYAYNLNFHKILRALEISGERIALRVNARAADFARARNDY